MLFINGGGSIALAFDFPTPPPAPTAPPAPTLNATVGPAPTEPPAPPAPTAPPAPWDPTPTPTEAPAPTEEPVTVPESSPEVSPESSAQSTPAGTSLDGQTGDPSITTGDANSTGAIVTDANTNTSATLSGDGLGGITVINSENGTGSTNDGSVLIVENNNTIQDNSAIVINDLNQNSISGQNSTSSNVGTSSIETGDANVTGTIITSVNTNVDGIAVAEFNVVDDQLGDIILDFGTGCLIGCTSGPLLAKNTGNGSDSTNTSDIDTITNNNTFQNNDATVENNMTLLGDSGTNTADKNTGGDSTIETGDANVSANALTFANNNIAGNVIYAVVNIFGDLIGDIIVPDGFFDSICCGGDASAINSGNGSGSTNTAEIGQTTNDTTYQFNNVGLDNNIVMNATTGENSTNDNTGGDSSITTGDSSIDAQVLNILNNNLSGGNYWLVIVNEAGRWIGRILGSDAGTAYGGSEEFEFFVNEFGEITVLNSGNGSGSINSGSVSQTTNNTLVQINDAKITNNLDLSANTGGNSASKNTGGDSTIVTGDAKIIANIVNFVNNNIKGTGKLLVTVVNVFGNWFGNFVGPGFTAEVESDEQEPAIGGANLNQGTGGNEEGGGATTTTTQTTGGTTNSIPFVGGVLAFNQGGGQAQVAKISISIPSATEADGKKTIDVNFAWALPGLFFGGIISMIVRRRHAI